MRTEGKTDRRPTPQYESESFVWRARLWTRRHLGARRRGWQPPQNTPTHTAPCRAKNLRRLNDRKDTSDANQWSTAISRPIAIHEESPARQPVTSILQR